MSILSTPLVIGLILGAVIFGWVYDRQVNKEAAMAVNADPGNMNIPMIVLAPIVVVLIILGVILT